MMFPSYQPAAINKISITCKPQLCRSSNAAVEVVAKLLEIMQDQEKKAKAKVKKGWLAVEVGLEEDEEGFQRFVIPISYLYHPLFKRLLEKAHEVYGYHTTGPLKLPCSVDDFLNLKWRIEKESNNHHHHYHHHHHHLPLTLSCHSC